MSMTYARYNKKFVFVYIDVNNSALCLYSLIILAIIMIVITTILDLVYISHSPLALLIQVHACGTNYLMNRNLQDHLMYLYCSTTKTSHLCLWLYLNSFADLRLIFMVFSVVFLFVLRPYVIVILIFVATFMALL